MYECTCTYNLDQEYYELNQWTLICVYTVMVTCSHLVISYSYILADC